MRREDYLDKLISHYSYDELDKLHELCCNYYTSVTGLELSTSSKDMFKNTIDQRPPLSHIRDMVDTLIKMFHDSKN